MTDPTSSTRTWREHEPLSEADAATIDASYEDWKRRSVNEENTRNMPMEAYIAGKMTPGCLCLSSVKRLAAEESDDRPKPGLEDGGKGPNKFSGIVRLEVLG